MICHVYTCGGSSVIQDHLSRLDMTEIETRMTNSNTGPWLCLGQVDLTCVWSRERVITTESDKIWGIENKITGKQWGYQEV